MKRFLTAAVACLVLAAEAQVAMKQYKTLVGADYVCVTNWGPYVVAAQAAADGAKAVADTAAAAAAGAAADLATLGNTVGGHVASTNLHLQAGERALIQNALQTVPPLDYSIIVNPPWATAVQLAAAVAPLATTQQVAAATAGMASTGYVAQAIAPLATTQQLAAATAELVGTGYVAQAIAPLATTQQLAAAVALLATTQRVESVAGAAAYAYSPTNPPPSAGGNVVSVNGLTGVVSITAGSIGALTNETQTLQAVVARGNVATNVGDLSIVGRVVYGPTLNVTNIDATAYGASQAGFNTGKQTIGSFAYGASQAGFNTGKRAIANAAYGAAQSGVNEGTQTMGLGASGARQAGHNTGTQTIGSFAYGASQAGYVLTTSAATNNARGAIQLMDLTEGQNALTTAGGAGSILLGAGTASNRYSIVAGDGQASNGDGSITAGGGFYGAGTGLTGIPISGVAGLQEALENDTCPPWMSCGPMPAAGGTQYPTLSQTAITLANTATNLWFVFQHPAPQSHVVLQLQTCANSAAAGTNPVSVAVKTGGYGDLAVGSPTVRTVICDGSEASGRYTNIVYVAPSATPTLGGAFLRFDLTRPNTMASGSGVYFVIPFWRCATSNEIATETFAQ